MSQAETRRGCHRHLRFRYRVQNCHGSFVQIEALLNKPLFVHPACDLWGTGDKGSVEERHILLFWTKINWEQVLKLTELHRCQCPTIQIETPEVFLTPPLKSLSAQVEEQLCRVLLDRHLSVSFPPSQQQLQLSWATLNYMVMYKPPLDAFTCGWQLLKRCSMSSLWTITVKSCSVLGLFVSTQSFFFFFCNYPIILCTV